MSKKMKVSDREILIKKITSSEIKKWAGDVSSMARKKDGNVKIRGVSFWGSWRKKIDGKVKGNNGGMKIMWEANGIGFGEIDLVVSKGKNPKLQIYTETMGNEFVKKVLEAVLVSAKRMD